MFTQTVPLVLGDLLRGFLQLLYPRLCVACGAELPGPASCFCLRCRLKLEPTNLHLQKENEFTDRFWGRLPVEAATAMYRFHRRSPIQHALHGLKYRNRPDIGVLLGRELGQKLRTADGFAEVEIIVPVPLHPAKERTRGYNQSACFARGLGETLVKPVAVNALLRRQNTGSQTRKKRLERFSNVETVFAVASSAPIKGKHVLLADDVLTTGATLEACARALLEAGAARVSMATIAIAMQ
jgi:ComF family protein